MVYLPGITYFRCFTKQMYKELINKQTFVNKKDEFFWMHLTSYHETKEQQRQAI